MIFRSNYFGERIAQPEASYGDVENIILDRFAPASLEFTNADLYLVEDDAFKFGGTVYGAMNMSDEGDDDFHDVSVEFDGFETFEDAKTWLLSVMDIKDTQITEVAG